jgi:hypothetical protein
LDGQQHPALVTQAAHLIDLRTPTQAAVTTFNRPESGRAEAAKDRMTLGDQRPVGARARGHHPRPGASRCLADPRRQDAKMIYTAVRARPEAAYDYTELFSEMAQTPPPVTPEP